MTMNEINEILHGLMRGIDKSVDLTVELRQDAPAPGVTVHLRRANRTGSLQISEADLSAAQTDLIRRNRVRTALKRARDRMWNETQHIFSTKMETRSDQGSSWFQPSPRGRGRR